MEQKGIHKQSVSKAGVMGMGSSKGIVVRGMVVPDDLNSNTVGHDSEFWSAVEGPAGEIRSRGNCCKKDKGG